MAEIDPITDEERNMDRKVIAQANNSLFGSHGYFLTLDGGSPSEHFLSDAIEALKHTANERWSEIRNLNAALSQALARAERAEKALEPFVALLTEMETGERKHMPDSYEVYGFTGRTITLGDFRRARETMEGK